MKMVRSYAIGHLHGSLLGGTQKGSAIAGPFSVGLKRTCLELNDTFVSFMRLFIFYIFK